MKKPVLLGVLVSLAVVATAFLLIRHRVMPLPTRQTAVRAKQSAPCSGTPDADLRDEELWEQTPEYEIVTNELYRIALAGDAWDNLTPDEVEALIQNMHSPHFQAREDAVIAAGGKYPAPVRAKLLPHVIGLLSDPVPGVRIFAAASLRRTGDKSVIPFLYPLLNDSSPSVARVAQNAILKLESQKETVPEK